MSFSILGVLFYFAWAKSLKWIQTYERTGYTETFWLKISSTKKTVESLYEQNQIIIIVFALAIYITWAKDQ